MITSGRKLPVDSRCFMLIQEPVQFENQIAIPFKSLSMQNQKLSAVNERTSFLNDADRTTLSNSDTGRRVSTTADADGVRHSFIVRNAMATAESNSSSIRAKINLWIEMNAFLLAFMVASTGLLLLMRLKSFHPLYLSYALAASPIFFGAAKISLDVVEPLLLRLISWASSYLNWHIVAAVTSFSDNIYRIVLSSLTYGWFWYHGQDPWLAQFFKALTISCAYWTCKDVGLRFVRRIIIVSSIMKRIRKSDLERDAMILLCCPDEQTRSKERRRWRDDPYRTSLAKKLQVIEEGALDLPLQPIGDNDVALWKYSDESYVRIKTLSQMRVIAGVLRDHLFEGGRRPTISYNYWCSLFHIQAEAENTWRSLFERDPLTQTDSITGKEVIWGIYQAFERRKRLTSQYMNLSNLFTLLETACNAIYAFIVAAIFGACLGADLSQLIVTISTSFVALSFALSGTITRVFESLVFIFVRKPFEIGDRITINDEDYYVDKIKLMSTILRKGDSLVVQFSNTSLSDAAIYNHRRSGPALISLRFMVSYETTSSQLFQLKRLLTKYVKNNSDVWKGDAEFAIDNLDTDTAVIMTLRCHHRLSWQDKGALDEHRYGLAECLRATMNQLKIDTSGSDSVHIRQAAPAA